MKQEKKGAKKEIRKDMAFLAGVKVCHFFLLTVRMTVRYFID